MSAPYPRDLVGYGRDPPHARWPGAARIALQFVLNFEEGAENNVLHGDPASEVFLSEIINASAFPMRHMSMESLYEYGARAGLWRVLRAFEKRGLPLTIFAVADAVRRHSEAAAAFKELGHEIACHGLRWISYQQVDESTERAHLAEAMNVLREEFGAAPLGWYTGRDSPQTRRLVVEHGGLLYDSDSYADDLPYWAAVAVDGRAGESREVGRAAQAGSGQAGQFGPGRRVVPHLVVPYALDSNDMRFATAQGFNSGAQFYDYLQAAFDVLYAEGDPSGLDRPKMLSVGLHCRLAGRPGRIAALERFLDYVLEHEHVWICRRVEIARHWIATHPYTPPPDAVASNTAAGRGSRTRPSTAAQPHAAANPLVVAEAGTPVTDLKILNTMPADEFVARLTGIFEHSPWVAERAAARRPFASRQHLLAAMCRVVDDASPADQRALIRAHPTLGSRARRESALTTASAREQRGAGLDACKPQDFARLDVLNAAYQERFDMPFILAVRGHDPASIIAAFERRLSNDPATEQATALREIGAIAGFRLADAVAE